MNDLLALGLVGFFAIGGALVFFFAIVGMLRAPDSLSKLNVFSSITALALPNLVLAAGIAQFHRQGFDWPTLVLMIIVMISFMVVPTIATFALGRALVDPFEQGTDDVDEDDPNFPLPTEVIIRNQEDSAV